MKKTAEQKRLEYEASIGKTNSVIKSVTPISEIHFMYKVGSKETQKSFITLEDLTYFLKCQNPIKLNEVRINTTSILDIQGLGSGLTFSIL